MNRTTIREVCDIFDQNGYDGLVEVWQNDKTVFNAFPDLTEAVIACAVAQDGIDEIIGERD